MSDDGRVAVIAGVGPGLGAAVAERFAAEGCRCGLLARTESFVTDLAAALPTASVGVECDLAAPDEVRAAFDRIRAELGPVEILVNHASGGGWNGLLDTSPDELDRAHGVAVRGGLVCSRQAVPDMLDGDGGTVVFTGATSAVRGRDGALAFSASKFAVRGLADTVYSHCVPASAPSGSGARR